MFYNLHIKRESSFSHTKHISRKLKDVNGKLFHFCFYFQLKSKLNISWTQWVRRPLVSHLFLSFWCFSILLSTLIASSVLMSMLRAVLFTKWILHYVVLIDICWNIVPHCLTTGLLYSLYTCGLPLHISLSFRVKLSNILSEPNVIPFAIVCLPPVSHPAYTWDRVLRYCPTSFGLGCLTICYLALRTCVNIKVSRM